MADYQFLEAGRKDELLAQAIKENAEARQLLMETLSEFKARQLAGNVFEKSEISTSMRKAHENEPNSQVTSTFVMSNKVQVLDNKTKKPGQALDSYNSFTPRYHDGAQSARRRLNLSNFRPICYFCRRPGHLQSNCLLRKRSGYLQYGKRNPTRYQQTEGKFRSWTTYNNCSTNRRVPKRRFDNFSLQRNRNFNADKGRHLDRNYRRDSYVNVGQKPDKEFNSYRINCTKIDRQPAEHSYDVSTPNTRISKERQESTTKTSRIVKPTQLNRKFRVQRKPVEPKRDHNRHTRLIPRAQRHNNMMNRLQEEICNLKKNTEKQRAEFERHSQSLETLLQSVIANTIKQTTILETLQIQYNEEMQINSTLQEEIEQLKSTIQEKNTDRSQPPNYSTKEIVNKNCTPEKSQILCELPMLLRR